MPNNKVLRWGIIGLVATVLLWVGFEFLKFVKPALPYAAGLSVLMIIGAVIYEMKKPKVEAGDAAVSGE